jgi:hypothetical protein
VIRPCAPLQPTPTPRRAGNWSASTACIQAGRRSPRCLCIRSAKSRTCRAVASSSGRLARTWADYVDVDPAVATQVRDAVGVLADLGACVEELDPGFDDPVEAQAAGTLACDFLTVETIGLTRLYVLFMIELDHRLGRPIRSFATCAAHAGGRRTGGCRAG